MSAGIAVVLLDVSGRAKRYGRALAVDDLSFQVRASEIVGLVGPNGAGKTTVLRCCVGVLRPSAGAVRVCGYDSIVEASAARRQMAFVPELPSLYPLLTVAEQIEFIARSAPSSPKASRRACARRPPWWRPSCTGHG